MEPLRDPSTPSFGSDNANSEQNPNNRLQPMKRNHGLLLTSTGSGPVPNPIQ